MGKNGVLAGMLLAAGVVAASAGLDDSPPPLRRSTTIAVRGGPRDVGDAVRLYNECCERTRQGALDDAARLLIGAIRAGFDDFSHLRRDDDLRPLRQHEVFRAILAARDAADPLLARRRVDAWRSTHDPAAYRYESDPQRLVSYASALGESDNAIMRGEVESLLDHLAASIFASPRHQILIVLPTPADAAAMLPDPHAHGHYSHRAGSLVAREPGRALRHELVHALHHAHMAALGQEHPAWIQEGLACLYEAWAPGAAGTGVFPPNDRDDAVRVLAARGALIDWSTLIAMDGDDLSREAPRAYPQLRSIFRFVADSPGGVSGWYAAYVSGFDSDPSGAAALETTLGMPLADLEPQWRRRLH